MKIHHRFALALGLVSAVAFAHNNLSTRVYPTDGGMGPGTTTSIVEQKQESGSSMDFVYTGDNYVGEHHKMHKRKTMNSSSDNMPMTTTASTTHTYSDGKDYYDSSDVRADNTKKNIRDRQDASITPTDQASGYDTDIATTRKIRSELMEDPSLSTYAKNVKIITLNGYVTLRGPVRSIVERMKVENHASEFVNRDQIINRIEVAPVVGSAR